MQHDKNQKLTRTAKHVLQVMYVRHCDALAAGSDEYPRCVITYRELMQQTGASHPAIVTAAKLLMSMGAITRSEVKLYPDLDLYRAEFELCFSTFSYMECEYGTCYAMTLDVDEYPIPPIADITLPTTTQPMPVAPASI